jgi:hypothetical protein
MSGGCGVGSPGLSAGASQMPWGCLREAGVSEPARRLIANMRCSRLRPGWLARLRWGNWQRSASERERFTKGRQAQTARAPQKGRGAGGVRVILEALHRCARIRRSQ